MSGEEERVNVSNVEFVKFSLAVDVCRRGADRTTFDEVNVTWMIETVPVECVMMKDVESFSMVKEISERENDSLVLTSNTGLSVEDDDTV